jgi:hypothetical protein
MTSLAARPTINRFLTACSTLSRFLERVYRASAVTRQALPVSHLFLLLPLAPFKQKGCQGHPLHPWFERWAGGCPLERAGH